MQGISEHERAAVERRVRAVKDEIYQLALVQMSEGVRAERLRGLLAELHALERAANANVIPAVGPAVTHGAPHRA